MADRPTFFKNIAKLIRYQAEARPDQTAFVDLRDGEEEAARLTFAELDRKTRGIARALRERDLSGERAILVYTDGLDFIPAFFGCLHAGVVAVPCYPPTEGASRKGIEKILAIAADCGAKALLTTERGLGVAKAMLPEGHTGGPSLVALATDTVSADSGAPVAPALEPGALAFLQYTSGSTSRPKGVMVTHGNLLANLEMMFKAVRLSSESVFCTWLPLFHDMGLIGTVIEPIYCGATSVLMSPLAFLQKPVRWLRAIARYGVTVSGGPNFAYDLCVQRIDPSTLGGLDLSRWTFAFNGAEPVRAATLEKFHAKFAPFGLRRSALSPLYGLAEATLMVSGRRSDSPPTVLAARPSALERNRFEAASPGDAQAELLVSCGEPVEDSHVVILTPDSMEPCQDGQIGEIAVAGGHVTAGYWNREDETKRTYVTVEKEGSSLSLLRTGDLGFFRQGELYVTGRLKDLIIIRGRNLYAHDIEHTVNELSESLTPIRRGCGLAFSVPGPSGEELVVVSEVSLAAGDHRLGAVSAAIESAVTEVHGVHPATVVLVPKGAVPKTSSGKLQRSLGRTHFLGGTLPSLYVHRAPSLPAVEAGREPGADDVSGWIRAFLERRRGRPLADGELELSFGHLGLDSLSLVDMCARLGAHLGREIAVSVVFSHPTPKRLAAHLLGAQRQRGSVARAATEPIAIVGMACRFPGTRASGTSGLEAFWRLLAEGGDAIGEVPPERWSMNEYFDPTLSRPDSIVTRCAGLVGDLDVFDHELFGISRGEAGQMDPQQRMLLQTTYEAFEHAGLPVDKLAGSATGVFIGISTWDFHSLHRSPPPRGATGIAHSIAANRLSHVFDLRGPCLAVDTACSSSLVALDLACRSLEGHQCDAAVVGGCNAILSPELMISLSQTGGMLSPSGRCHTFDAAADGYVRGEGCGIVVLKRLSDALRQRDRILALVRGTAVNHVGRSNGLTAPSGLAQREVIETALARAAVRPGDLDFVEAHGTATRLGDPVEVHALDEALGGSATRTRPLWVGSVKTNVGHLEAAAGIAGVIKTVLAMQHEAIPRNLHFSRPSPHIGWHRLKMTVPTETVPWPRTARGRFAGVSSFGFGGTNAHAVLESAELYERVASSSSGFRALVLSAESTEALRRLAGDYGRLLRDRPTEESLAAACVLGAAGRRHFPHRLCVANATAAETADTLEAFAKEGSPSERAHYARVPDIAPRPTFLFAGQGAQYSGMGRELSATQPAFREALERAARLFEGTLPKRLLDVMFEDREGLIDETLCTQPALFCFEHALAAFWKSLGVVPGSVLGHSVGEYAGAVEAGVLSLETAARLVRARATMTHELSPCGMMAVAFCGLADVAAHVEARRDRVSVAAINGPKNVVLSGEPSAVTEIMERLEEQYFVTRPLRVSFAAHSPFLDAKREEFLAVCRSCDMGPVRLPFYSSVYGRKLMPGESLDPDYWWRHLRQPVLFHDAAAAAVADGTAVFLEVGPADTLSRLGEAGFRDARARWIATLDRDEPMWRTLSAALGALYTSGAEVDWSRLLDDARPVTLTLPSYPFAQTRVGLAPEEVAP